jgi:bla regulator protein blaR1
MASQTNFLQSLGWAVLNSLWQLALLWVVYQLLTGIFKQAKPAAKSLLASSLLMAGFGWFVYTFITAYFGDIYKEDSMTASLLMGTNGQLSDWLQKSLPIASIVYLSLLLLPVFRFVRNYRYVQIIRRYGLSKLNVEWRMFINKTATRIGIKKPVQTWVSELVSSPVTIGFWKPVILVPLAAINHLTPQQLEAVLLHELSHIRRSDYLINLLLNLIQTILYFNPFVRAFVKIVEREREKSCDEMVLQFQYDSHEYATALLTLEKVNYVQKPLAIAAAGKKNDLLHRIETILGVQHKPTITFNKLAGLFTGLLCIIALNGLLIINKPVTTNNAVAFADFSAPVTMFTDENSVAEESATELTTSIIATSDNQKREERTSDETETETAIPELSPEAKAIIASVNPEIINASLELAEQIPHLNKMQEQQVKEAIAASRKVIEDVQWKKVEKDIADVFSRTEKEKLKATYEKELGKMNWTQWENKLRQAYDKVDWERVNEQLSNAVSMVRIDSLQSVYSAAISKLDIARSEMKANNLSGIPDTDVTLKDIEQKRKDLLQLNNYLKGVRSKKIVRL